MFNDFNGLHCVISINSLFLSERYVVSPRAIRRFSHRNSSFLLLTVQRYSFFRCKTSLSEFYSGFIWNVKTVKNYEEAKTISIVYHCTIVPFDFWFVPKIAEYYLYYILYYNIIYNISIYATFSRLVTQIYEKSNGTMVQWYNVNIVKIHCYVMIIVYLCKN